MSDDQSLSKFLRAAEEWVCRGYSLDVRYLAGSVPAGSPIWNAAIQLNPLPVDTALQFEIDLGDFFAGQLQCNDHNVERLIDVVRMAVAGKVEAHGRTMTLATNQPYTFTSEMNLRERWFYELHLEVVGNQKPPGVDLADIDNKLRCREPPFDGIGDVARWLGFVTPSGQTTAGPNIVVRIGPPCDLIFHLSSLQDKKLHLVFHAHPEFDVSRVVLAVHTFPVKALSGRMQVASKIRWGEVRESRREGVLDIEVHDVDSVLTMLMIGTSTVRRQWFVDPTRARNFRLSAVQCFDSELRMTRHAVLDSADAPKFERGVAALLFLQGFSPCIQLESDAPDLIVQTPLGKLVLIECTTRIADFATKMGKLVDRRGALVKHLKAGGHTTAVMALLVCRLPRDQIAMHEEHLRAHQVILVTGEDLTTSFDRAVFPGDPDKLMDELEGRVKSQTTSAAS